MACAYAAYTQAAAEPGAVTDQELLKRFIRQRDEGAFAGLVERHSRTVLGLCRRLLHQEQDAEDAFQAVFLVLARKAEAIRKGQAVGSWLYSVAYRTAMKARKTKARRSDLETRAARSRRSSEGSQPWGEAAARELQRLLDEELQNLADKYRAPFVLCCLEGLSKAEAAKELHWKEGTVSGRLAEARKLLKTRLARRGIALSAVLTAAALAQHTAAAAVPAILVHGTVGAVLAPAAAQGAAVALSPAAVTLAQGVMHTMAVAKLKAATCLLLALTALAGGGGFAAYQLAADGAQAPPVAERRDVIDPANFLPPPTRLWTDIDEQVLAIAFSLDGKKLVTAGARYTKPGQLKIWDLETGASLVTVKGMRGIRAAAMAPDGNILATGHFGGDVVLRDPATGEERSILSGHKTGVNSLAFSADSALLASAGLDSIVKVWDVKGLKEQQALSGHKGMVFSVAFFRHGRAIVSGGADQTVKIWDLADGKEKFTLSGHGLPVETVAVSPDDKLVATGSWDGKIKLWDAETGKEVGVLESKEVGVLESKQSGVLSVAFSHLDGKLLASATADGAVHLWDIETKTRLSTLGKHAESTWAVAFSPDGKRLASGSSDKTACLWDVAEAKKLSTFVCGTPASEPIWALAYAPDGKAVALALDNKTVQLRDTTSGDVLFTLTGHADVVTCVAFSPDGQALASGSGDQIKLWDRATGNEKLTLKGHTGIVQGLAFTPEGKLVSAGEDQKVIVWDPATEKQLRELKGHDQPIRAVAVAPDGKRAASGGSDGLIKVWDLAQQAEPITLKHGGAIRALAFAPDGALASAGEDAAVRIWDVGNAKERHLLKGHPGVVWSLAFSPGGRLLASGGHDGRVIVWDAQTGKSLGVHQGHKGPVTGLAVHPQAEHLLSGGMDAGVLRWRGAPSTLAPLSLEDHPGGVWFAHYSPSGTWLASGNKGGSITLWSRSIAPAKYPFQSRYGGFWDAAFAPDGKTIAIAKNTTAEIWDAVSGQLRHSFALGKTARSVACSADGKYLAATTGSWQKPDLPYEGKLFDLTTSKELATLEGHTGVVFRAAFSPDGKTLATSSKDKTIRLWDVPSGNFRGVLTGHRAPAKGIVFLPEGTLVTASWDKTIRFWDVTGMKQIKEWNINLAVASLDVSPDGTLLAAAEAALESQGPAPLKVWQVASGKEVVNLEGHANRILGVAFTRDGRGLLASGGKTDAFGEVYYWDLATAKLRQVQQTPGQWIESVASSPDGKRAISAATNGIHLWDVDFMHKERTWPGAHRSYVSCGLFRDDRTLITGSLDWTIGVWDIGTDKPIASLKGHKAGLRSLALLPGRNTLVSSSEDGTVKMWDLPTATEKTTLEGNTMIVYGLAVSPDGKLLAACGGDHRIKGGPGELILWDLATGKLRTKVSGIERTVWSVAFSPDGALLAAIDTGFVKVFDVKTGQLRTSLPAPFARPVAFAPDGKLLAVGLGKGPPMFQVGEGSVHLWNTQTWQSHAVLPDHKHFLFTVAFSPDGGSLASAGQDGTIKIWPVPGAAANVPVAAAAKVKSPIPALGALAPLAPPADVQPAAGVSGSNLGWKVWLALGIVLFLAGTMTLALWRHRSSAPTAMPEGSAVLEAVEVVEPVPAAASVAFRCPSCGKQYKTRAARAGKKVKCPNCGEAIVIPET